jgi:hypothetical protein
VARGGGLSPTDGDLVGHLLPHELRLFSAAPAADQAHGARVARRVAERLDGEPRAVRAALLHDAGKARAPYGVAGRTLITAMQLAAPVAAAWWEERATVAESGNRLIDPVRRSLRPGAYLAHGPLAAAWLARHGTEEEVTAWVREHHRPEHWPELPLSDAVIAALAGADE